MNSGQPPASQSDSDNSPASDASAEAPPAAPVVGESAESENKSDIARGSGPLAARGLGVAKPASPAAGDVAKQAASKPRPNTQKPASPTGPKRAFRPAGIKMPGEEPAPAAEATPDGESPAVPVPSKEKAGIKSRVAVPNLRQPLTDDLMAQLESELSTSNVGEWLEGPAGLENRQTNLEEGAKVRGTVLKMDDEFVYVSLGGPDEGVVSRLQFEEPPETGTSLELMIRGFNREDGLYNLTIPGQAMEASDWDDLEEGSVVEAHVAAANTGGLEATVGSVRGFIPISQIALYRVEDANEFVGQRMVCLVTECNPRRKNLVLSRRAILEREREEQRQQKLESLEPGDNVEGTVGSIKDFGAFVDLGGVDGLIHVSKLSWENVKHPSDVLAPGQKVKVKVEKIDKQTGKISLSYRDLLDNPWDSIEATAPVGSVVTGTISRIANFGAFVRIGAGIEGLVHISELASHRVSNVNSLFKEGDEVQVKVLSIERESQRVGLSIKQAQSKAAAADTKPAEEEDEPVREPAVRRQHDGPLKGGVGNDNNDNPFGLNLG